MVLCKVLRRVLKCNFYKISPDTTDITKTTDTPDGFAQLAEIPTRRTLTKLKNQFVAVIHVENNIEWVTQFLAFGGGEKLLDSLESLCSMPLESTEDARTLLLSLECVKMLLSTEPGLSFAINRFDFAEVLSFALKTNCLPGKYITLQLSAELIHDFNSEGISDELHASTMCTNIRTRL